MSECIAEHGTAEPSAVCLGTVAESKSLLHGAGGHDLDEDDIDDQTLMVQHPEASQWRQTPSSVLWSGTVFLLLLILVPPVLILLGKKTSATSVKPKLDSHHAAAHELMATRTTAESKVPQMVQSSARRELRSRRAERRRQKRRNHAASLATVTSASPGPSIQSLVHTHVVPQGGSLAIECAAGTFVQKVHFASFGIPQVDSNGSVAMGSCHSRKSMRVVKEACVGQSHCCLPVSTENFRDDPCRGKVKTLAVVLEGCAEHKPYTRYKRHCSLLGQSLLCDEDIEFLAGLQLPQAPEPVPPRVAFMVDTSWRPSLQHYVVHNVHNHTGWPIQLFHGPSNGPKLKVLFADLTARGLITFTDLGTDYMEDWQRLSSMMLIDNFWEAVVGRKALVFQPDSIMCAASTRRIEDFLQYEYVGAPMAGPWWMTSDHDSQWSVGCGGFSLRDRSKSILMTRMAQCITPAAGKLEDQQLGTMWKYLEKRCAAAGVHVHKPTRFEAIKFAVEYDLQMDVLPGDDAQMPDGCEARYYTGPKYDPGHKARGRPPKWNPTPKPAPVKCRWPHFVPMACHKCWHWNWRTWKHMTTFCPEVSTMRRLRSEFKVGIEFTGWPTRPKPTPLLGPRPADPRYLPIDLLEGHCKGRCDTRQPRTDFRRTKLGQYHP